MRLRYFRMYSGKQLTRVITTTFHKNSEDIRNFWSEKQKMYIYQIYVYKTKTKSYKYLSNVIMPPILRTRTNCSS